MAIDHRPQVAAQRRERMRARLMQAAFSVAGSAGVAAVTIDAVVARAEVARGSFYKYFDSPQSLLEAVGRGISDALLQAMHPVVSQLEDPAQRIAAGVRLVLRIGQLHPPLAGFLVRSGWPAADMTSLFYELVGATLRRGIEQGRFTAMPEALAHSIVVGTMVGTLHALESDASNDLPERVAGAVLRALGLGAGEADALATSPLPMQASDLAAALPPLTG